MFKAIKNWWNGLWEKEESPGPKITKEQIDRMGEVIREIKEGSFDRTKPTGTDAECIAAAVHAKGKVVYKEAHTAAVQRGINDPEPSPIRPLMTPKRDLTVKFTEHPGRHGLGKAATVAQILGTPLSVERDGRVANIDEIGELLSVGEPKARTILPGVEISSIAEPGIEAARKYSFDETVSKRLADPKPVPVSLDELCADTAVPTPRKPRRRGKRGGVKRNNRSKKK